MNAIETINKALTVAEQRESENSSLSMYSSIVEQLKYLSNYINGKDTNRTKLSELTFGIYAAKELEETDPEFAKILSKAFYVATQKSKGLKVNESILNE